MTSGMLDIQSLPSLERFDSQLLELFRQSGNDAGGTALHVMDELQAPDDEMALQGLMSIKDSQQKAVAAVAAVQLQHQQQGACSPHDSAPTTSGSEGHGTTTPFAQPQSPHHPQHAAHASSEAAVAATEAASLAYAAAGHGQNTHAALALPYGIPPALLSLAATNPFATGLASLHAPHTQQQPESAFAAASGATDMDAYARNVAGMAGFGGSGSDSGVGFKRRMRGAAMADLIRMEQDYMQCKSPTPIKRGKGAGGDAYAMSGMDSDEDEGAAGLSISADMDEATRARIRREKNRVAARKCRAKKMQFMVELQKTLRELMSKNEEYRLQVITWQKMFSREVRLREAMKRIIAVMWQSGVPPAASGYTANDVIIGLESENLDINSLAHTFAILSAQRHLNTHDSQTGSTAAAAAAAAAGLGKVPMNGHLSIMTANGAAMSAHGVDSPRAAAAAAAAAASGGGGGGAAAAGSMLVPDTPHGQPGSAATQLQQLHLHVKLSDASTQNAAAAAVDVPRSSALFDTAAELTGMQAGNIAGGTGSGAVSSSTPLNGQVDNAVLPHALLLGQSSHATSTAAALPLENSPAAPTPQESSGTALTARRNTSAQLEEVLAAVGFGSMQKADSMGLPGLPDMRTQSSGLRALSSGSWVWRP